MESKSGFSLVRLFVGLVLLAPMLVTCLAGKVVPALYTVVRSVQAYRLAAQAEFVGLDNYARLFRDSRFLPSVGHTIAFAAIRLFATAIVPVVLAFALSKLGRRGRILYRVCLTLIVLLFIPISLFQGWRIVLDPHNTALGRTFSLSDPDRALLVLLILDGLMSCTLGGTLGTMLYMMVFRGAQGDLGRAIKPLLAVWLIVNLCVVLGAFLIFDLPFVLTSGGPAGSTTTWVFYAHMALLRSMQMGYAAAMAIPLMLLGAPLIVLIWGIGEWSGLRLAIVPAEQETKSR
ncbi:MAG: sugar ABC transporter permease, partial [Anaerolineae bacterium]|nr:sugar ABC transporter permease [Anaerolineae bacterium]